MEVFIITNIDIFTAISTYLVIGLFVATALFLFENMEIERTLERFLFSLFLYPITLVLLIIQGFIYIYKVWLDNIKELNKATKHSCDICKHDFKSKNFDPGLHICYDCKNTYDIKKYEDVNKVIEIINDLKAKRKELLR